mmetsp:Transcript_20240/g.69495  ORF Transcript_20240/g.69495 Transcript_20240/m.69495 type:complete len:207 (-) Transcript_20240:247-867(-)
MRAVDSAQTKFVRPCGENCCSFEGEACRARAKASRRSVAAGVGTLAKAQATFAKTCGCNSASFAFKSWCEIASKSFASKRRADAKAQERLASSRSLKRAPCPKSFNAWDPSASKTPSKSAAPSSRRAPAANAQANRETSSAAKLSASSKTRLETTWYNWPSGICFCKRCCAECFAIAQTIRDKCGAENESIAASTRAAADAKTFGE